jgi:hypothetical protein
MIKVKVQTSPAGTFPVGLGPALAAMNANRVCAARDHFPHARVSTCVDNFISRKGAKKLVAVQ